MNAPTTPCLWREGGHCRVHQGAEIDPPATRTIPKHGLALTRDAKLHHCRPLLSFHYVSTPKCTILVSSIRRQPHKSFFGFGIIGFSVPWHQSCAVHIKLLKRWQETALFYQLLPRDRQQQGCCRCHGENSRNAAHFWPSLHRLRICRMRATFRCPKLCQVNGFAVQCHSCFFFAASHSTARVAQLSPGGIDCRVLLISRCLSTMQHAVKSAAPLAHAVGAALACPMNRRLAKSRQHSHFRTHR